MIYACLERAKCLVMKEDGEIIGWVGLADVGGNWWSFDIAIKPEWQGKWDYVERLKEVGKYVFTNLNAQGIVGICHNPASIKLGLKCGMTMTDEKDPHDGIILKLSREDAKGKWF
jgi:RimJ/RimL family protein N-acetyltransferase